MLQFLKLFMSEIFNYQQNFHKFNLKFLFCGQIQFNIFTPLSIFSSKKKNLNKIFWRQDGNFFIAWQMKVEEKEEEEKIRKETRECSMKFKICPRRAHFQV